MRIAHTVDDTEAEGPGRRFALWVQGCTLRCKGCCNPELFDAIGGKETSVPSLLAQIGAVTGIEGVSILGGEPTEQADLADLCEGIQALGLTVMVYSGRTRGELEASQPALLNHLDLLVDGRYDATQAESERRWIGSKNQVLHFLSDAYSPTDAQFSSGNTVEIRWGPDGLLVNGWPAGARKVNR